MSWTRAVAVDHSFWVPGIHHAAVILLKGYVGCGELGVLPEQFICSIIFEKVSMSEIIVSSYFYQFTVVPS